MQIIYDVINLNLFKISGTFATVKDDFFLHYAYVSMKNIY